MSASIVSQGERHPGARTLLPNDTSYAAVRAQCVDKRTTRPDNCAFCGLAPLCKRFQPTVKECFDDCSHTHSLVAGRLRAEFADPRLLK